MKKTTMLAAVLLAGASVASADEPEDQIKYRQATMSAIGGHMGASTLIVRGKIEATGALAMHARSLDELTDDLAALFPKGSDFGETKSKAEIWDNWSKFETAAGDTKTAAGAFAEAVAGGDAAKIADAHKELGKTCKGCHEDFRQKDD